LKRLTAAAKREILTSALRRRDFGD